MSYATFGVNDTNAVKLWSKMLAKAERDSLEISPLMGEDDNAIIHVKADVEKGKGDKVTFSLRARPSGAGFTEGETAEGNAEALTFYADSLYVNELGHNVGAASENTIDQQRVPFDLREQCKNALTDWFTDRKSASFFNQVAGYTPQTNTKYTGMNAALAPSGATGLVRQVWAGTATNDQGLGSSDTMVVTLIDKAVESARSGSQAVRQIKIGGQKKYVAYLSEGQVTALRTSTSTNSWTDITKFAYSGVDHANNPIYTGALGEYNNTILRRSQDCPRGANSGTPTTSVSTVRRGVLLGAQAAVCAYGMKYQGGKYRWNEELMDHKRKLEASAWSIWGLKKAQFNSVDYGTVVISTYSTT